MSVSRPLPDVAFESAALARPLDWVGMEGIALPLALGGVRVPASIDVAVNLGEAGQRGIHMSRLYLKLQQVLPSARLDDANLRALMRGLIDSQEGIAQRARLVLRFDQLLERPALISANRGWKRYPVELALEAEEDALRAWLRVEVEYSSTCPASAALSRELNAEAFAAEFGEGVVEADAVRDWLASKAGLAATPHAQRSVATVRVALREGFEDLPLQALVDALEAALGTPVQTAVKREDEQAFARANAENLMFCEDAARRVGATLAALPWLAAWEASVAHLESLHAHDAVARLSGRND
ncbi:GTP cyclohydrolase I FolE2 [Lysobacter pythonis]|uniref:GTP cyclohydrolase FolE2 n=2 Tax=Solilutibacter pythonis TaxID=2483112 RepID=A0A3M2HXS0_9GAMM|nr:GTP cyclohydrolase I FolE2 [Lysobacter pythonis]